MGHGLCPTVGLAEMPYTVLISNAAFLCTRTLIINLAKARFLTYIYTFATHQHSTRRHEPGMFFRTRLLVVIGILCGCFPLRFLADRATWVVLLEDLLCGVGIHGLCECKHEHVSNGDGYGCRGRRGAHAKGYLLQFVDWGWEEYAIFSVA